MEGFDDAEEVLLADGGAGMRGTEVEHCVEGEVRVGAEDLPRVFELALSGAHLDKISSHLLCTHPLLILYHRMV